MQRVVDCKVQTVNIRQKRSEWGCWNKMELELSLENVKVAGKAFQEGQLEGQRHGKEVHPSQHPCHLLIAFSTFRRRERLMVHSGSPGSPAQWFLIYIVFLFLSSQLLPVTESIFPWWTGELRLAEIEKHFLGDTGSTCLWDLKPKLYYPKAHPPPIIWYLWIKACGRWCVEEAWCRKEAEN